MARKPRLLIEGGFYHVMLRGNGGHDIFFSDEDRAEFERLVAEGVSRFGHRIHAYCWMTNHVHLAIEAGPTPLSKIIQNLAFRYTRWVNKRQSRIGHLFQGRYKAIMVEADSYFLELVRYIHLNPVRANLVSSPDGYAWSGHDVYLGRRKVSWLTTEWALSQWGARMDTARARYRQFVQEGMAESRREDFHRGNQPGQLLGGDNFAKSLQRRGQKSRQSKLSTQAILNSVMYVCGVNMHDLQSSRRVGGIASARGFAAYLVLESGEGTLTGLGELLNRDVSTLSNAASAMRTAVEGDETVRKSLSKIIKKAKLNDKTKRTKA